MSLGKFIRKQFIDVIHWTEPEGGILAWRVPMEDMEIQYGAQLTVRETQVAAFVNEGRLADVFGPGLHTLRTENMPVLTNLMHWDKMFQSPFKSDVYFFSTRLVTDQRWGTAQPVTVRDRDFGAVRLRAFGAYSYHIANVALFHAKMSGTREEYRVADLEPHLRNLIVGRMSETFATSGVPFLDMAANLGDFGRRMGEALAGPFGEIGLALDTFVVESLSLPDELQKRLDERIGMGMVGDLSEYTRYQVAQSIPKAAANEGGAAGAGAGLGAGIAMGQAMVDAMRQQPSAPAGTGTPAKPAAGAGGAAGAAGGTTGAPGESTESKFCIDCGKPMARRAKFCPECGASQG